MNFLDLDGIKKFSNTLKAQLLSSVTTDANYACNTNYDYVYKLLEPASGD